MFCTKFKLSAYPVHLYKAIQGWDLPYVTGMNYLWSSVSTCVALLIFLSII